MAADHERIWLQNEADAKASRGDRLWCQDKVWPADADDHEPTEYVRADLCAARLHERLSSELPGDVGELVKELRESGGQFSDGEAMLYDPVVDARNQKAADLIESLVRERDEARAHVTRQSQWYLDTQKEAAARYGFEPGQLQWAWRQGQRTDRAELEYAIVDALGMGGIAAGPGDGASCAAQIVTAQMDRAEAAEANLAQAREALKPFAEAVDVLDDEQSDAECIWESSAATKIDVGDLRRARSTLKDITP